MHVTIPLYAQENAKIIQGKKGYFMQKRGRG